MATYRANLDESVVLKSEAEALNYFWVRFSRHFYNESTFVTQVDQRLTPYDRLSFQVFQKVASEQNTPERLRAVVGWDEWEIIHNPELIKDVNDLLIK